MDAVDGRSERAAQSLVGVLLLGAFVFRLPWIVPLLAVLVGLGAAGGPTLSPFHRAFGAWIAPRLGAPDHTLASETVRFQDALVAGLLGIATVMFGLGIALFGWALALAAAVTAVTAATTRVHLGEWLRRHRP